ncbi:hypothetical protein COU91_03585, partial [Candidatus Saccharibacteria bacterium CG10_big_fil_rev_8_21_14_0_10_47_8]
MNAKIPAKPSKAPKPSKATVYVDVDDEITAIIDKVENAKHNIVALVLPKRATMLQSIVNMRLLKRSSDTAGKSVVLITSETALLPLAGAAGLHTARNLQSKPSIPPAPTDAAKTPDEAAEEEPSISDEELSDTPSKLDYHRSIGELATASADNEDEAITLEDEDETGKDTPGTKPAKVSKDKKLKIPNFERFRLFILLGAVGAVGLIVFIIFAIFVLPKATVTIKTASVPVSTEFNLTTSDSAKALDLAKKTIPATLKTTEQKSTAQVPATGQQNNGTKASGTVSMSAGSCSADVPNNVPAGTGISSGGLTFITQKTAQFSAVISGGKCTFQSNDSIGVTSQSAGAKYNLGPSSFTVAGRSDVSASSSSSMGGGTDNIITIVSQADLNNAKTKITSADTDKFVKAFEDQLAKDGFYVLTSTLKPSDPASTASPAVGQPAATTTVETKITYTVLAVQKADLSKAINDSLSKQVDKNKQ